MAHDKTQCPRCGGTKWDFSSGWFQCQRCGELEPAHDAVVFQDDPRLVPDDYDGGGDAA